MNHSTLEQRGDESDSHWVRRTVLVTFCLLLLGTWASRSRASSPRAFPSNAPLSKNSSPIAPDSRCVSTMSISPGTWTAPVPCSSASSSPIRARTRARRRAGAAGRVRHLGLSAPPPVLAGPRHAVVARHRNHRRSFDPGQCRCGTRAGKAQPTPAKRRTKPRWCGDSRRGPSSCRTVASKSKVRAFTCGVAAIVPAAARVTLSQAVVSRGASASMPSARCCSRRTSASHCSCRQSSRTSGTTPACRRSARHRAARVPAQTAAARRERTRNTQREVSFAEGLIASASWQASARELEIGDDPRARFDHLTVNGKLDRDAGDFLLSLPICSSRAVHAWSERRNSSRA